MGDVGRNLIHNPLFYVAQRGAGPWTTNGVYTLDRWFLTFVADTNSASQLTLTDGYRTAIGDEAAQFGLQNTFAGNAAAGAYSQFLQRIEKVQRLSGKTVTLSFWASAGAAGLRLGANITQVFGTGGSPSAAVVVNGQSVTLSTSIARYNLTFAIPSSVGKTFGTNGDDWTQAVFWFSSGATNNVAAGNIGVQSGTIVLWGVQLEIGSVATPLEKPDPRYDLDNCRRFYQTWGPDLVSGYVGAPNPVYGYRTLSPPMRVTPTCVFSGTSYSNASGLSFTATGAGGAQFTINAAAAGVAYSQSTVALSADL
jgi:hypothetical protein